MTQNENIEFVVQKAIQQILNGKLNRDFFAQLEKFDEYIEEPLPKDLQELVPLFRMLSWKEMKTAKKLLSRNLIPELYKDNISFLQIMRVLKALVAIDYNVESLKKINKKVEFCIRILQENIYDDLELIALLDKI